MTTYTILDGEGYEIERGLSLAGAAHSIMTSDSRKWEIRPVDGGGFSAWARQPVANRGWTETALYSAKDDRAEAEADIAGQIVNAERMAGHYEAMTDQSYDEMQARLAADEADEE